MRRLPAIVASLDGCVQSACPQLVGLAMAVPNAARGGPVHMDIEKQRLYSGTITDSTVWSASLEVWGSSVLGGLKTDRASQNKIAEGLQTA